MCVNSVPDLAGVAVVPDRNNTGLKSRATRPYFDPFFASDIGNGRAASVTALIFEA